MQTVDLSNMCTYIFFIYIYTLDAHMICSCFDVCEDTCASPNTQQIIGKRRSVRTTCECQFRNLSLGMNLKRRSVY